MNKGIIKTYKNADLTLEGEEICRLYFQTDKITFGMSELAPGKVGDLDKGHADADEVFFCMKGRVICFFPEENKHYELEKGDALLIPPNMGHQLYNLFEETAVIIFACAPRP